MKPTIFERIENAKPVDFGNILSKSFELYKTSFKEGLMHSLVGLLVVLPFILVVYIPLIPMYVEMLQNTGDPYYTPTVFEKYSPAMIFGWAILVFFLSFLMQVVTMSIYGHYYKVLRKVDTGSTEDIGGYFTMLQENFGKLLLLSLAIFGIAMLAALLCYLPLLYVIVPLQLVLPILIFNKELSVSEIIKASFKLGNKYWGILFGLIIVSGIIGSLGMIACYIGLIATMFFTHIVMYYFYKDSVGFDVDYEEVTL